jgi:hypothetical protein
MFVDRRPVSSGGGLPWLLTAGALLAGIALARAIDWRAHAHPRL